MRSTGWQLHARCCIHSRLLCSKGNGGCSDYGGAPLASPPPVLSEQVDEHLGLSTEPTVGTAPVTISAG
jgi:hypothetical protein